MLRILIAAATVAIAASQASCPSDAVWGGAGTYCLSGHIYQCASKGQFNPPKATNCNCGCTVAPPGVSDYCKQCTTTPPPPPPVVTPPPPPVGGSSGALKCTNAANFMGTSPCNTGNTYCGECASLIAACTGKGWTCQWKKGGGWQSFQPYDVIATWFGDCGAGTYGGHVVVFKSWKDANCANVIHQNWSGKRYVHEATICKNNKKYCNTCDLLDYYQVTVPAGLVSSLQDNFVVSAFRNNYRERHGTVIAVVSVWASAGVIALVALAVFLRRRRSVAAQADQEMTAAMI